MTMLSLAPLLNALFPPRCAACGDFVPPSRPLCGKCEGAWPLLPMPRCSICALPFATGPSHICGDCLGRAPAFERLHASGVYEGLLLDLVVRLKYRGEERLAAFLGERMSETVILGRAPDVILPVPLYVSRLRERGFNQAVLLARRIGKRLGIETDALVLRKIRPTAPQATLKMDERRKNLKGAFRLEDASQVRGRTVLLVDDVATTGATLDEAARVLKEAGAARVEALVAARAT